MKIVFTILLGWLLLSVSAPTAICAELYVSTGGSDSSACSVDAPCITVQRAVDVFLASPAIGTSTIHIGPGAFCSAEVAGPTLYHLSLIGAGSAQTTISGCGGSYAALYAHDHANVGIGSLTVLGGVANASGVLVYRNSALVIEDGDVNFGAAAVAQIKINNHSSLTSDGNCLTFSGSAQWALWLSTQANAVLGIGCTHHVVGNPNYSQAFVSAIGGSFLNLGTGSGFVGSATGRRYSLALNSYIDTEQITTPLPGSMSGFVSNGSYYYTNAGLFSVSGAPSGLGAAGWVQLSSGNGDQAGFVFLRPAVGAGSSGSFHLSLASVMGGPLGAGGSCVANLNPAASTWAAGANVQAWLNSASADLWVTWNNNGVPLLPGAAYDINYMCQ